MPRFRSPICLQEGFQTLILEAPDLPLDCQTYMVRIIVVATCEKRRYIIKWSRKKKESKEKWSQHENTIIIKKFYYRYLKLKVLKQQQTLVNKIHKYRPSPHQETTDHGYVLIIHNFTKEKNGLILAAHVKKEAPWFWSKIDYFYHRLPPVLCYYYHCYYLLRFC